MSRKKKKRYSKAGKSYSKSDLRSSVMSLLRSVPNKALNYKQISARLGVLGTNDRKLVLLVLEELIQANFLESPSLGKYKVHPSQMILVEAKMDFTKSGMAYAIPESEGRDIFIREKNTGFALHGDMVELTIIGLNRGQPEGKVVRVLNRSAASYVGVIQLSKNHAFFIPSNQRIHVDFFIHHSKLKGAKNGQKVIVEILRWSEDGSSPEAEVITVLGDPGQNDVEMHAILAEYNLPIEFPEDVLEEAENIHPAISQEEIAKRRDFRDHITFTIDPDDAKDFDDALSIKVLNDDEYEVGVHIADVSHYLKPNGKLDKEAKKRATSVYLVDRVVPMLPEVLSNYVCSLRPNEDKLCMSAVFVISKDGIIKKEWFGRTIIKSNHRFTYADAQTIIADPKLDHPLAPYVRLFHEWASHYREKRIENGALEFSGKEVKFELDSEGKPLRVFQKRMGEANYLIEEFMLLANRRVAKYIGSRKKGIASKVFVYRVHDSPDPEKLLNLKFFASRLGYRLKSVKPEFASAALNDLLGQVKGKAEEDIIKVMAIRSMAKAVYTTDNIGHYGLGFEFYTHFTSPIRRYPDVLVHRLLAKYLAEGKSESKAELEKSCKHSSEREKKAAEAERASIKYKQVEFMLDKIGQFFQGSVSGLTRWGMYVEILDIKIEGMIPLRSMDDDVYRFDDKSNQIIGQRYGEVFDFGDLVNIQVVSANLMEKQLEFRLN